VKPKQRHRDYIKAKRRVAIIDLFGKVDYDPAADYKSARRANAAHKKWRPGTTPGTPNLVRT
jgi:hypothetical protein